MVNPTATIAILLSYSATANDRIIPSCQILVNPSAFIGKTVETDVVFAGGPPPDGGTWIEPCGCTYGKRIDVIVDETGSNAEDSLFRWMIHAFRTSNRQHHYGVKAHAKLRVRASEASSVPVAVVIRIANPRLVDVPRRFRR